MAETPVTTAIPPSARLGLPAPSETDPSDVPVDIKALRDALDVITAVFGQGPSASIPAPGTAGRFYFATDSKQLLYDDGTAWQSAAVTTGDIKMTGGSAVPAGWLLCDGTAYSRTQYANLYGVVGTAFGAGDGTTTFNVPDLRGRAPVGAGTGSGLTNRPLGSRGGEEAHLLVVGEMPAHAHPISVSVSLSDPGHAHSVADGGHYHTFYGRVDFPRGSAANVSAVGWGPAGGSQVDGSGTGIGIYGAATGISVSGASGSAANTGGSGGHNNMPPYQTVNWLIKT